MAIVPPLIMKHHARFPLPNPLPEGEGQSPEGVGGRVSLREFHVNGTRRRRGRAAGATSPDKPHQT